MNVVSSLKIERVDNPDFIDSMHEEFKSNSSSTDYPLLRDSKSVQATIQMRSMSVQTPTFVVNSKLAARRETHRKLYHALGKAGTPFLAKVADMGGNGKTDEVCVIIARTFLFWMFLGAAVAFYFLAFPLYCIIVAGVLCALCKISDFASFIVRYNCYREYHNTVCRSLVWSFFENWKNIHFDHFGSPIA